MSNANDYELKVDWKHDYLLRIAIHKEMRFLWKQCCFMAPRIDVNEHYFGEEIDHLADYLLQIDNHK